MMMRGGRWRGGRILGELLAMGIRWREGGGRVEYVERGFLG